MDNTLKALLRYVKQNEFDSTWQGVRDNVFAPLYHDDMRFFDVMHVLLEAYKKALAEPRFEMRDRAFTDLILAPLHRVNAYSDVRLETEYSIEQFYAVIILKMLSDLRLTRADWCRDELTG